MAQPQPSRETPKAIRAIPTRAHTPRRFAAILIAALAMLSCLPSASAGPLIFCCSADNDLFRVASANGMEVRRFDTPGAAVVAATQGEGVLLLALQTRDPKTNQVVVDTEDVDSAKVAVDKYQRTESP